MAGPDFFELVPVGIVGKPHGVKGEIRVHSFDPSSQVIHSVDRVVLQSNSADGSVEEKMIRGLRRQGKELVLRLDGVESRTHAELLRGHMVLVPKSALPKLSDDEFYDFDLLGLSVRSRCGEIIGMVKEVEHPPSSDVLVVELTTGEFVDVPMIEPFIVAVETDDQGITVDLLDDLPRRNKK